MSAKKKSKNLFFVILILLTLISATFVPVYFSVSLNSVTEKNVSLMETTTPKVMATTTTSITPVNDLQLAYDDAKNTGYTFTISIADFDFSIGDQVIYMIIAPNATKWQQLFTGENAILEITSGNRHQKAAIPVKPSELLRSVGTYSILANIIHNGEPILAASLNVEISLPAESNYQLQISYQEMKGDQNELSTYNLSAQIFLNSEQINADNMLISWYFQNSSEPFRRMNSNFEWTPSEPGVYTIFAKIEGLSSGAVVQSKTPITITVAYNNSKMVLVGVGILAGIALIGVIIVTIIKVKSEKVW